MLDRILAAIGIDRSSAYIANVIPWRPPGNRTPTPQETEICRPFIERQIELANPKVLVTLGGPSAKVLLNTTEGVLKLRGNWRVHRTRIGHGDPGHADAAPGLSPAQPGAQEARLARLSGGQGQAAVVGIGRQGLRLTLLRMRLRAQHYAGGNRIENGLRLISKP